jgi:hypothetical protein
VTVAVPATELSNSKSARKRRNKQRKKALLLANTPAPIDPVLLDKDRSISGFELEDKYRIFHDLIACSTRHDPNPDNFKYLDKCRAISYSIINSQTGKAIDSSFPITTLEKACDLIAIHDPYVVTMMIRVCPELESFCSYQLLKKWQDFLTGSQDDDMMLEGLLLPLSPNLFGSSSSSL